MKVIPEYPIRTNIEARTASFVLNKINHENCHQNVTNNVKKKGSVTEVFLSLFIKINKPNNKNNNELISGGIEYAFIFII